MFTWICPECGAEVDVSESRCPRCRHSVENASTEDTADKLPRLKETKEPPPRADFHLKPAHVAFFVVALVVAVGGAIYFSSKPSLQLEDVPEAAVAPPTPGSAVVGPIELTGLRFRYDEQMNPLVQAVVINHSNLELDGVELSVQLNTMDAPEDASPLATFEVSLKEPLGPQASTEIEAPMLVAGTLQALPTTERLRVAMERVQ